MMPGGEEESYQVGVVKTLLPLGMGLIAGIISFLITQGGGQRDPLGIIALVLLIYAQKPILPKFGIEPKGKDWALLGFLSFTAWYISWTFILNL